MSIYVYGYDIQIQTGATQDQIADEHFFVFLLRMDFAVWQAPLYAVSYNWGYILRPQSFWFITLTVAAFWTYLILLVGPW